MLHQNIHVHLEKANFGHFFFPELLIVRKYFHAECQYHAWSIFPPPPITTVVQNGHLDRQPRQEHRQQRLTTLLSCVSQRRVFFDKLDASQTLRTASTCILK